MNAKRLLQPPVSRWVFGVAIALGAVLLLLFLAGREHEAIKQGADALERRDYDLAVACYNEVLRTEKDNSKAYLGRGQAYSMKKEYDKAIADYTEAVKLTPDLAEAYYGRGSVHADKNDHDKAVADYSEALRIDPTNWQSRCDRGVAYINKQNFDKAIEDFSNLLSSEPRSFDVLRFRAIAYERKREYKKAIADIRAAFAISDSDIGIDDKADLRERLADCFESIGDYDQAIDAFGSALLGRHWRGSQQAVTHYIGLINAHHEKSGNDRELSALYWKRGVAFELNGDIPSAIWDWSEVIRRGDAAPLVYYMRGLAYRKAGDHNKAVADFTEVIARIPNSSQAYHNRGWAYKDAGKLADAVSDFDEAVRHAPMEPFAYFSRGIARKDQGDYDGALADFSKTLSMNHELRAAYQQRAIVYREKGDFVKALDEFDKLMKLVNGEPEKWDYDKVIAEPIEESGINRRGPRWRYRNRGDAYAAKGNYEKAIADYSEALRPEVDKDAAYLIPDIYNKRGLAYDFAGDYQRAIADFKEAIRLEEMEDYERNLAIACEQQATVEKRGNTK